MSCFQLNIMVVVQNVANIYVHLFYFQVNVIFTCHI